MTAEWRQLAVAALDVLGPARLRTVADDLAAGRSTHRIAAAHPVAGASDAISQLARTVPMEQRDEAATYIRGLTDGWERRASAEQVESVWSGPQSHEVPVRATAQVLVGLIDEASRDLLLMTYSAKENPPVAAALCAARERGVRVTVVVETVLAANGAISSEPALAFRWVPGVEMWHWPPNRRPDPNAKMHAKIAVADRRVLLTTSANLTQSGAGANLEAGLLVRGGSAPARAAEHVDHLIAAGTLARLHSDD